MNNNEPLLVDTGKGFSVKYQNRNLYSLTDPLEGAVRRVAGFEIPKESVVIVPSPLLGYGLIELKAKLPPNCHILCIEIDQQLMSLTKQYIPDELLSDRDITFLRVDNPAVFARFVIEKQLNHYRKGVVLSISGGFSLNRVIYKELEQVLSREIQIFWQNKMTLIHMGRLWIKNIFRNLPLFPEASCVSTLKTDKVVCLVGAGISLEGKLNEIYQKRQELFILAVDTALPVLLESNIIPDALVAVEGQFYNLFDFYRRAEVPFPIICDITSYPGVMHSFPYSKIFLFASSFVKNNLLNRLEDAGLMPLLLPPMGSVGVISLYLALGITQKSIVTVGLDFSYLLGKTHARSSYIHSIILKKAGRFSPPHYYKEAFRRPFEKIDTPAGTIYTDPVLKSYAGQFSLVASREKRVYNWGAFGLDLGIPEIDDISPLFREERAAQAIASERGFSANKEIIEAFLKDELETIDTCIEMSQNFLQGNKNFDIDGLRFMLEKVDYIFVGFPDIHPLNLMREEFVARFVISASICKKSILYAIKFLNSK